MDSVAVTVPLRPPMKKMKKRKELDALAPPHAVTRRTTGKRSSQGAQQSWNSGSSEKFQGYSLVRNKTKKYQELLSDSSDECSEFWNVSTRGPRKLRHRSSQSCPGLLRACSAFLACAAILATASLIWLFIDVRQQLTTLRSELDQAIAGSEGLPDAIQKCDSTSKQLQKNQTNISIQIFNLKAQLHNFSEQMTAIQRGLQEVQDKLKAEPQLATFPNDFESLQKSVAVVGSQLNDLNPSVLALKEANKNLVDAQKNIQQNISSLQTSLLGLTNITQKPLLSVNGTDVKIEELKSNVSQLARSLAVINQNFTARIDWALEEQQKDHNKLGALEDKAENISAKVETLRNDFVTIPKQINDLQLRESLYKKTLETLEKKYSTLQNSQASGLALESQPVKLLLNSSGGKSLPYQNETKDTTSATNYKDLAGDKMSLEGTLSTDKPKRSSKSRK